MFRVLARNDIKNNNVINTVCLEGLKVVGEPAEFALRYYELGADELILNDLVASLYQRNNLYDLIEEVCKQVFIPTTVIGGVRSLKDAEKLFKLGADKIGLNTEAVKNPIFVNDLAKEFGSQSIIGSIETRPLNEKYMVLTDGGREIHDIDAIKWCQELIDRGVGEILITSVDRDGRLVGLDEFLVCNLGKIHSVPIIISGGIGRLEDFETAYSNKISGVAVAGCFHREIFKPNDVKNLLSKKFGNKFLNL